VFNTQVFYVIQHMTYQSAKENILKKVRKALVATTPLPFPGSEGNSGLYPAPSEALELVFAEQFSSLQGRFLFCADLQECADSLQQLVAVRKWTKIYCVEPALKAALEHMGLRTFHDDLATCEVAITGCEYLVARTGTMVLSSAAAQGRTASVYAPIHICIAHTDQLVYDTKDALQSLKEKYGNQLPSFITFATGPSRTADIEKTLVVGIHGPGEVFVVLTDEPIYQP
jgi:L-lactate dehydrogenase complex protein LldG